MLGSQYITVNVQTPNTGGGDPCGGIAPFNGVIYPPPCNGGGLMAETAHFIDIAIFDLAGRIVKHKTNVEQVDTNDLSQGMYIVRAILNDHEIITQKILK
ncbi:MAG: T9SS type A sorting domain-containing protein [Sphingobacteriales bacterium]|nr:T9SS type A sorting domain-containing protein [Sphingobacteriales bacterium]